MKLLITLTIVMVLSVSCQEDRKSVKKMKVGNCFMEINKQFVSGTNFEQDTIYRIDGKTEDIIRLSTYQNRRWVFLGEKPVNTYKSGKRFEYMKIDCPDSGKSGAKLSERIKKIDL